MGIRQSDLRALRIAGGVVAGVGIVVIALSLSSATQSPLPRPMPVHGDDFLRGSKSIDDIQRDNNEWFEGESRRMSSWFGATAAGMAGFFFLAVGGVLFAISSQRLLRLRSGFVEQQVASIARGAREGWTGESGSSADPSERLAKVQRLRDEGLITEEEFRAKRREIVAGL